MLGTFLSNLLSRAVHLIFPPYHSGSANRGSKLYLLGWVVNAAVADGSSIGASCFSTCEMRLGRATEHENGPRDSPPVAASASIVLPTYALAATGLAKFLWEAPSP
jgi:hypothetical protein